MERGRKHPQFYHVCEVVEVRGHTPFQEIPIKTTGTRKKKGFERDRHRVISLQQKMKVVNTHRTSRVSTSPIVDGMLPSSRFPSNSLTIICHYQTEKNLKKNNKRFTQFFTYTWIKDMSELNSWLGISPESWFLLKWLHNYSIREESNTKRRATLMKNPSELTSASPF